MTRHQYGISALVSQTSFRGETTGGVAKCRLFSPTNVSDIENREWEWLQFWNVLIESCRFEGQNEYEIQLKVGVPVLKKRHPGKLHFQGAKKVIFAACHSGKLKLTLLAQTSFQLAPKGFWRAQLISQFFCNLNSTKDFTCASGKLRTEFTNPIAISTSPGLSDTTSFACWFYIFFFYQKCQYGYLYWARLSSLSIAEW